MKILKSLNKKKFLVIFTLFLSFKVYAENEPVDIWNIDKQENNTSGIENIKENDEVSIEMKETDIYKMQTQKKKIK